MDLYFYTKRKDLAATSLADLQAMIAALADESDPDNAAIIAKVTGKVESLVQADSGEPLNLYWYSDASTAASWPADASVTLAIGLGLPDPTTSSLYASTTSTSVSGVGRVATLSLNTAALSQALYSHPRAPYTLHLRKTENGVTETVGLLPVVVKAGVLTTTPSDSDTTSYVNSDTLLTATVLNKSGITSLTGGGGAALDGLNTAPGSSGRLTAGCVVLLSYSLVSQLWKLVSGTDAENVSATPAVVRPDDYNASTNAVVWKQIG